MSGPHRPPTTRFPGKGDLANSLSVTPHGDVVYYLAALGVVYNRDTHQQRFFTGHDDDIRCIAQHPDGVTFATAGWLFV